MTQILLFRLNAFNIIIEIKKLFTLMNFLISLVIVTFCVRLSSFYKYYKKLSIFKFQ